MYHFVLARVFIINVVSSYYNERFFLFRETYLVVAVVLPIYVAILLGQGDNCHFPTYYPFSSLGMKQGRLK